MSVRGKGRSILFSALTSRRTVALRRRIAEATRRLTGRPHVVSAFLQLDDPYSYLLSRYLPALREQFDIELRLYLSEALGGDYQPEPALAAEYAVRDCAVLARELGIPFLDRAENPPAELRKSTMNTLAAGSGKNGAGDDMLAALESYWRGDARATAAIAGPAEASDSEAERVVAESQARLKRLGHYNSAMLQYAGEWYWGIDRLHYLEERLVSLGVARDPATNTALASLRWTMDVSLPVTPPAAAANLPPLEMFFSFRSPYSHIALFRVTEIAAAFGVDVKLRPVLPLVMRGVAVPRAKLMYIARDAAREAARRQVPFGRFADPLGPGIERCLAAFDYAQSEQRASDFSECAAVAIWADGIDLASDGGMRTVCQKAGLFWPDVAQAMQGDQWREMAARNREAMMQAGLWGVPVVRMGDLLVWGQDRDWLLARHLEEACETGDGIIV